MQDAAMIVTRECIGIKKAEEVLIIVDKNTHSVGTVLFNAAKSLGAEVLLLEMLEGKTHGSEPPHVVAEAMKSASVIIMPTTKSLTHTKARLEATKQGARIASMPTITEDIMRRTMSADYARIKERSEKLAELLSNGSEVQLTAPGGTVLTFSIAGRKAYADTGDIREKGSFSNLPAGEAYIAPVEGKTSGIAVIDGSMAGVGVVNTPVKMVIKDGYVTELSGGSEAETLSNLLQDKSKAARNIAELGIGTNEKALPSGSVLEDEKVMGTVHIAIGDNTTFGGVVKAPLHIDGIIKTPTLAIDGQIIIKNGKHLI